MIKSGQITNLYKGLNMLDLGIKTGGWNSKVVSKNYGQMRYLRGDKPELQWVRSED